MTTPGESAFQVAARMLLPWGAHRRALKAEQINRELTAEVARLREVVKSCGEWPPGHFYSPLPSEADVKLGLERAQGRMNFAGVDQRGEAQRVLLGELAKQYPRLQLPVSPDSFHRYHLDNPSYGQFDGILFACMVLHYKPRRIIEIGSGCSSALMLDLNDRFAGGEMELTFIEPYPERLRALLRPGDLQSAKLIERKVQEVPIETFKELGEGDILFVDSSHVSKVGSDVNHIFFEVLPVLAPGVLVHFHDVSGNFEYPKEWFAEGRAWNEMYLLWAFLMHNRAFEVSLHSPMALALHREFFRKEMPMCDVEGGGQIWIRRTSEA